MPVQPPTTGQLREIAESFGLVLGDEDLDSFRGLIVPRLDSFTAVEEMPAVAAYGGLSIPRHRSIAEDLVRRL